jgi:predicted dehydrogenase
MIHGARNDLEISVYGTKGAATWCFMNPDEIEIGRGDQRQVIRRDSQSLGLQQWPFHGGGWIEGYVEVLRQGLNALRSKNKPSVPSLKESLDVLKVIL